MELDGNPLWVERKTITSSASSSPAWPSKYQGSVDNPQWQTLSMTDDSVYNQFFPEDAPFELDESYSVAPARLGRESEGFQAMGLPHIQRPGRKHRAYRDYSPLTISEERELRNIAMPPDVLSDANPIGVGGLDDLPEPATQIRQKKRKSSMNSEADDANDLEQRKKGHNAIEKRYRTNLNSKIFALQQCIPSMRIPLKDDDADKKAKQDEGPNIDLTQRYKKAAVLTGAVDYITELATRVRKLDEETAALKIRLAAFEKLVMSGSMVLSDEIR